jgi:O-antigen/teichoic acid export membrane protein
MAPDAPTVGTRGERIPTKGRGLRIHTARGTIVNAAFNVGLMSLTFVKGLIVAALIGASEYGVWGILFIALGTLYALRQVGIGEKYIQQSEADQELEFQRAFTLELVVNLLCALLLLAAVPVIAAVYGRPELVLPGVVFSLMVLGGVLQTPLWIFYRRMDFVRQRLIQAIDPIVGFVVTIALAVAGAGYWSLVIGVFLGTWVVGLVALKSSPYRIALKYDRGTLRRYLEFSWPPFIAAFCTLVIAQGAILAGEAELGLAGAGAITLAATIAQYTDRVDGIITTTLYPAICAVKDRRDLLFESFVKSNRLALMWGVPFGVGLTLFASDLVSFGIGEEWRPAVILLQVFGLNAAANHIGFNWDAFYRALGNTRPIAVVGIVVMLTFLAVPLPLLISDGLEGFAIGMAIMTAVSLVVRTIYLVRLFPAFAMARHAARAIAPTIPAVGVVLLVRELETFDRSLGVALSELGLYGAVTVAFTFLLERDLLREVAGYLRARAGPEIRPAT